MRALRLETADIHNTKQLRNALDALVDFPDWYDGARDEWVDLISYFDHKQPTHQWYRDGEFFIIEIVEATQFLGRKPRLYRRLLRWTANVNKQYIKRAGRPVLALVPLPDVTP